MAATIVDKNIPFGRESRSVSPKTYTWEDLNYFRMQYVIFDVVEEGLRQIFKQEWDFRYKATQGEWQDTPQNGREFIQQETTRNVKKQMYLATIEKGNTADWDASCLLFAILHSQSIGSSLRPVVRQNVNHLRVIRNEIAHSCSTKLTDDEVHSHIGQLVDVFSSLGLPVIKLKASVLQTCSPVVRSWKQKHESSDERESPEDEVHPRETASGEREPPEEEVHQRETASEKVNSFCLLSQLPPHEVIRRSKDIDRISKIMNELEDASNGAVSTIYLSGTPGIGKSQLARQIGEDFYFSRSHDDGVSFVATLNAETLESLTDSCIMLAYNLGITLFTFNNLSRKVNQHITIESLMLTIVPKLRKFSSWLLILDNANDLQLINCILPSIGSDECEHGHVLITTQVSPTIPRSSPHTVLVSLSEGMRSNEAVELLTRVSQLSDEEPAKKVAEVLEYHPLALATAAFYIRSASLTWAEYLDIIDQDLRREMTELPLSRENMAYPKTMTTAIKMALRRAVESDDVIRQVFHFFSLCAMESLPLTAVVNFVKACTVGQTEESITSRIVNSYLICCISGEDGSQAYVQVPKAVYEVIRKTSIFDVESTEQLRYIAAAMNIFDSLVKEELEHSSSQCSFITNLVRLTSHCQVLLEHVISAAPVETILQRFHPFISADEVFSWLCTTAIAYCRIDNPQHARRFSVLASDLVSCQSETAEGQFLRAYVFTINGKVLEQLCEFQKSLGYLERALFIQRQLYGEEHSDVAACYHSLGTVYSGLGQYNQSLHFLDKAVTIRQTILGEVHEDVAASLNDLAVVCNNLGRFSDAIKFHERALMIRKKINGEYNDYVATSYHSLGIIYSNIGEYNQAKEILKQALAIRKQLFGDEHGDVAASYHSLGIVYSNLGQYKEAIEFHEKALVIEKLVFGEEHGDVAGSYHSLGVVSSNLGAYNQAKEYYKKALNIRREIYGEKHGDVSTSLHHLAVVFSNLGEYDQAKEYYERALHIRRTMYGEEHRDVAATLHNLGIVYSNLGQYSQARELHEKALFIRRKIFGEKHRDVAASLSSLGVVFCNLGEYIQARELHHKALMVSRTIFGEEHGDVAASLDNLGVVCSNLEDDTQAKEFYERALSIRIKLYTEKHVDVAESYSNLGAVYYKTREFSRAKELYEKALVILKTIFGGEHAAVASVYNSLEAIDQLIGGSRSSGQSAR